MRALVLSVLCVLLVGCMKRIDLAPMPHITRFIALRDDRGYGYSFRPDLGEKDVGALVAFMDGVHSGWTRAYGVGFGPPSPAYYAHLYDGDRYVGYFAVGAGVLPASAAYFQVRYGDVFAQKRVTKAEANRFLALIGISPEL